MELKLLILKKQTFSKLFLIMLLVTGFTSFSQVNFYSGPTTQTEYDALLLEVTTKKSVLEVKINDAEAQTPSLETSYAIGTVKTVNEFIKYSNYDKNNATTLQTTYEAIPFRFWNNFFNAQITNVYPSGKTFSVHNPFQQLHDCVKILDRAILEIDKQLANTITLAQVPDFTTSGYPTLPTNSNYYMKDGNIIFPSTFWGLRQNDLELLETLGYLGEVFHSPGNTQKGNFNGNPNAIITRPNFASSRATRITNQIGSNQTPTQLQFTHTNLSADLLNEYPDIESRSAFVHYDIDHPEIRNINESILDTYVPSLVTAANGSPLIYVLSNEPHWDISQGQATQRDVSDFTYDAHEAYLVNEYGTIGALNSVYGTSFTNFSQVRNTYNVPLNRTAIQGTPPWYDWLRFNMDRSNRWHKDLKDIIRDSDPNAQTTIKLLGRELEDPIRDGGIDLEYLMDLQEIIGFDNQVVPNETHGRNNRFQPYKNHYLANYIMDWREQSIMLDFARSVYPNKPTFDSEWHGHSSNAWNNHALDASYTRSALWMAFTTGLSVINNWWWYREDNGALQGKTGSTGNTMFSPQHQAVAFDEFGRTMKELNAHSSTVASLVSDERDYLFYYSGEAAIQDWNYMQNLARIYEAFKLLNVKVGFTTENKINALTYTPKAIIITPTLFIKDSSLDALNTFRSNNSGVDILQVNRFNAAQQSFIFDEKGISDTGRNTSFTNKNTTYIDVIPTLIDRLRAQLNFPTPQIDFDIVEPGTATEAFGVFASEGSTPDNKKAMSLINLSLDDREIQLSNPTTNLITGETVSSQFIMKPYDVLLITDGTTLSNDKVEQTLKSYTYYPNPVSDVLTIKNTLQGTYKIYSITGALVKTITSKRNDVEIKVNNLTTGVYFLEIPTENGNKTEKIIVNR